MSREIKFRCWSEKEKAYLDGPGRFLWVSHDDTTSGLYSPTDLQITLEQNTGLLDKNGKEIYEGDILRNTINGGTWHIYWDKKDAAFWVDSGVAGCSLGEFDWDRSNREYGFVRKNCEVISNVHESPELVGGEE